MNPTRLHLLLVAVLVSITPCWSANFVGPAIIACPLVDLGAQPCAPDSSTCTTSASVSSAQCVIDATDAPLPTDETYYFALPCACHVMNNCPDSCQVYDSGATSGTSASAPTPTAEGSPSTGSSATAPTAAMPNTATAPAKAPAASSAVGRDGMETLVYASLMLAMLL